MQVVECSIEPSTRKTKKGKEKQDKDVQSTKKKPKAINMTSIVEGGGNIEAKGSETKTWVYQSLLFMVANYVKERSNHL